MPDRIQVLHLVDSFCLGGSERQVANLVAGLRAGEFRPHVACFRAEGELLEQVRREGVPFVEYPLPSLLSATTVRRLIDLVRYLRRHRVAVVHTTGVYANAFGVTAAALARTPAIVASVRDMGGLCSPGLQRLQRWACRLADAVVANADAVARRLRSEGWNGAKIEVIRNGFVPPGEPNPAAPRPGPSAEPPPAAPRPGRPCEPAPAAPRPGRPAEATPAAPGPGRPGRQAGPGSPGGPGDSGAPGTPGDRGLREELGIPPGVPLIGAICRLHPVKRLGDLLDAVALLAERHPAARVVLVGPFSGGPVIEGCRRTLRERADLLGIGERVIMTGARTDVPRILAELSVSVLPSASEGLSNALLESMAAGVPVVATAVGGTPEVVEDGMCGLLVPPADAASLAAAIGCLLDSPQLAAALGEAGRRRVEEHFGLDRMVEETTRLYRRLLARPNRSRRAIPALARFRSAP